MIIQKTYLRNRGNRELALLIFAKTAKSAPDLSLSDLPGRFDQLYSMLGHVCVQASIL